MCFGAILNFFFQMCRLAREYEQTKQQSPHYVLTTLSSCVRMRHTNMVSVKTETKISKTSEACQTLRNDPPVDFM